MTVNRKLARSSPSDQMVLATILAIILPLSLAFWIMSLFGASARSEVADLPSPFRWFMSVGLPVFWSYWGWKRRSLDWSGALTGLIVGFILTLSNYCFMASLLIFFVTSSKATKYKSSVKRGFESDFKESGERNWVQVICNGGVAAQMALLFVLEHGVSAEIPINFRTHYNASWFSISVLAAIACANGDTWASELGSVLSKGDPRLITTLKKVPRGTNGGVSLPGLLVSAVGGLVVGATYYFTLLLCANSVLLASSPKQWPILVIASFAGLFGSVVDSLLGATLQYSGVDIKTGKIVETPGDRIEHISGCKLLDNHSVNLLSILITALVTPQVAIANWA